MDYHQAQAIGQVGERRVEELLRSEAASLGYRVMSNLLVIDDETTAQIDHVVIDRFGILVVETKNYHALIRGKSDDKFWTACYSGKERKNERFLNPLLQNDRHRERLQSALGAYGRDLPPGYVQSLIVFAGGDLNHLKLSDADSMRVLRNGEVVDYLRARCGDFQPNPGTLDAERVAELVSLLESMDKSQDSAVVDLHGENVSRATRRFGGLRLGSRPASHPGPSTNPYGAARVYNQNTRYPDGSQHSPRRSGSRLRPLLGGLLATMLLAWLFIGGGLITLAGYWDRATAVLVAQTTMVAVPSGIVPAPKANTGAVSGVAPVPAGVAAAPVPVYSTWDPASTLPLAAAFDVRLALRQLKQASPKTYRSLTNASRPRLSTTNGLPTYTWQYVDKSAANVVSVREVSITLDSSGHIVGVTGAK